MDNSQSSDIFSESSVQLRDVSTIEIQSYEALVSKIKGEASYKVGGKSVKLSNNSSILDDCSNCVFQGFDIIVYLLEDPNLSVSKLCYYLEETIYILQIISNFIKNIIETMAVTCCSMKTFSTTTGKVILSVFSHCKESECIYGSHIRMVEKQLKDLFRNCHELQLTYLMILENHFIFDLTVIEDQDILMETLDINLKIGELVQALDVKTMAEQWKGYTMICEKYSNILRDKDIYDKTTKILVDVVQNNIKTAVEATEEDKIMIRSLKVASFSLKILLRIIKILKNTSSNSYGHIVELLQEILLYNSSYYEITNMLPPKILNITKTHLLIPSEAIISSLVTEENFINYIDSIKINNSKDQRLLQYILLVLAVMKAAITEMNSNDNNFNIIKIIISLLPHCHTYFNMELTFSYKNNSDKKCGLFEHMLIHTLAGSTSLNDQYYIKLQKLLFEAILTTDYLSGVFCSNLWVLLCRSVSSQLQLHTLVSLIEVYQKLETNALFRSSPQHINLSHTIENLFKLLQYPEKLHIYKQFSIYEAKNDDIWCVLKIKNLPENLQMSARKMVTQKVSNEVGLLCKNQINEQLQDMIKVIKLASTCEFLEADLKVESLLVQGWCKVCPKANKITLQRDLDAGSLSYFRFLEALASLTESYYEKIADRSNFVKILHVVSDTLLLGNIETTTLLFKIFCKLIVSQEGNCSKETVVLTLKYLLQNDETQEYIYSVISNEDFGNFVIEQLSKENKLQEAFNSYNEYRSKVNDDVEWQERLMLASENRYEHKCIQGDLNVSKLLENNVECNFESTEFDVSFDIENDHPVNKKAKLDMNVDDLMDRLESDVSQLCQVKENLLNEYKTRIRNVCDKLRDLS